MRPTKPPPQSRAHPQSRVPTTIGGRGSGMLPKPQSFESPMTSPVSAKGGVRYVTVAIPADMPPTPENMAKYFHPPKSMMSPLTSPLTVCTTGTASVAPGINRGFYPNSPPFGFVPILDDSGARPFSPPALPYDYGVSPSPSMMSTMTTETYMSRALDGQSPAFVPTCTVYRPSTPLDSQQRPKTPNTGRKSPFVKSPDDDSVRKSRLKTEMCMHYSSNRPCPFGSNCTYAHGEQELQMTKLLDLSKAGLIDVDTYRCKPCLTWVATGSCPFGKRCAGIHDPRVGGTEPSWLPHTETQGNTIATDINVDSLHQKRLHSILYGNPFGDLFSFTNSWGDLYKLVCCTDYSKEAGWIDKRRQRGLNPIYKLQIAIKLRGKSNWQYKYRPQHIIHDELCMVLQKRAFRLGHNMQAIEISLSTYNANVPTHVLVREIAFGPDSDPAVRGVSLWFNINETNVEICTPQQAKRFRWKRGLKTSKEEDDDKSNQTAFQALDSFPMIRPDDRDAFQFASDIMKHRLHVLQTERLSNMKDRFEALKALEAQKKVLQERFDRQKQSWMDWAWPINVGREKVNKRTPVPPVDGKYSLQSLKAKKKSASAKAESDSDEAGKENACLGSAVHVIWGSFVSVQTDKSKALETDQVGVRSKVNKSGKRLSVFGGLALGEPLDKDRTLPHIHHRAVPQDTVHDRNGRQQEHCWKALLLESDEIYGCNEWDLVQDHFENSRSKKVLSIIQQKGKK